MPSRTEEALAALHGAIEKAFRPASFPTPARNETLDVILERMGEKGGAFCNVIDGNGDINSEALGSDDLPDGYEIIHRAEIEWLVMDPDPATRDATFDDGLLLLDQAVAVDIEAAGARTLGGFVSDARLVAPIERSNPRTDGLPGVKYALVTVQLTFKSSRIF